MVLKLFTFEERFTTACCCTSVNVTLSAMLLQDEGCRKLTGAPGAGLLLSKLYGSTHATGDLGFDLV